MSLQTEIDTYIVVCENLKGLSKLTIKAYKIDSPNAFLYLPRVNMFCSVEAPEMSVNE